MSTAPSPAAAVVQARQPWAPEHRGELVGSGWLRLAEYLADFEIGTATTTAEQAGPWACLLWDTWQEMKQPRSLRMAFEARTGQISPSYVRLGAMLVAEGMAAPDLYALLPITVGQQMPSPSDTARTVLHAAIAAFEDAPVRDMVGWLLAAKDARDGRGKDCVAKAAARRARWAAVGLGDGGWLYAGAGLTPIEARAGLDAGTLTQDQARMMAGLRGASLPIH